MKKMRNLAFDTKMLNKNCWFHEENNQNTF